MKKQHGVIFQAPSCPQCGAEMELHRWAKNEMAYICPDCQPEIGQAPLEYPADDQNTPEECFW